MDTIWIFGDQLTDRHPALQDDRKPAVRILMIESRAQITRLPFHQVRLAMQLSAMRHFAAELERNGWAVDYHRVSDTPDFESGLQQHLTNHSPDKVIVMRPNSFDEQCVVERLSKKRGFITEWVEPVQFLRSRRDFSGWAAGRKRLLMETHYREMRERLGVLIDSDGHPVGGKWNWDSENRKTANEWDRAGTPSPPQPPRWPHDEITKKAIRDVAKHFPGSPGRAESMDWPVTRAQALEQLRHFTDHLLGSFGDYEDLMIGGQPSLYHSRLSAPINLGLLLPMECVEAVVRAYRDRRAPLNSVEGFVRQILGWREFVNGIYWLRMPGYLEVNELSATRPLPAFFWNGDSGLNCMDTVLAETLESGFNHHIQRLMVLGNFLLLSGVAPREAFDWYSAMYVDSFDWVMAANVLGMTLHADGGLMATKPYAGSGTYIHKMSNYCGDCQYRPDVRMGPRACPYNLLYWHFYDRHAGRFERNPRTAMMVRSWKKRSESQRISILREAEAFLDSLTPSDPSS